MHRSCRRAGLPTCRSERVPYLFHLRYGTHSRQDITEDPEAGDGHLPSLSGSSQNDDDSDAEDFFGVSERAEADIESNYRRCFLYRWRQAVSALCDSLRENVLLPLHPDLGEMGVAYTKVDTPVVLPSWHCAIQGCTACSRRRASENSEAGLWKHIWDWGTHRRLLTDIMAKYGLREPHLDAEEVAFTLYGQALNEKERSSCPLVGAATDRRTLQHLGEVFYEDNVSTLMCFICGCKHIRHIGFDKFGAEVRKGTIDYRADMHRTLHTMFCGDDYDGSWRHNFSYKSFKDRFGEAVASDPGLQDGVYEWKRKVQRRGVSEEMLCCPEDVQLGPLCRHDEQSVCSRCRPIDARTEETSRRPPVPQT
jgi:hypothetical protein